MSLSVQLKFNKYRYMKVRIFLIISLFLLTSPLYAGGPWPAGKGHGYLKLSQRAIVANSFFNLNGEIIPITTTGLFTTSVYGEYGLSDRFTLRANVPVFFRATLNEVRYEPSGRVEPGDQLNSLGDIDLGFSYAIIRNKPFVLGVTVQAGIPTGNPAGGETGLLQSGDGEFNQLVKIDAGYSFYPKPFYISGSAGINNRTRGFSEEAHVQIEAGATFAKKFLLILKTSTVRSFKNGDAPLAMTGIFSNNTQYLSFGPEFNYLPRPNIGISAGVYGAAAAANILAAPSLDLGFFLKW
jgi:protein XagA